jgi:hypothetical protein
MELSKKTWMSLFIAAIMILSVLGFALTFTEDNTQQLSYNDTKFTRTQTGWQAKINGVKADFSTFPSELEDIPFDEGAGVALDGAKVLWFTYNPKDTYAQEIADTLYYMEDSLGKVADIYVQRGLTNNSGYVLPEATCANATITIPVFLLQSGNETSIKHNNGCIIATASSAREIYRIGDRMLYQEYKVMK